MVLKIFSITSNRFNRTMSIKCPGITLTRRRVSKKTAKLSSFVLVMQRTARLEIYVIVEQRMSKNCSECVECEEPL